MRELHDWLATLDAQVLHTIGQAPRTTIQPARIARSGGPQALFARIGAHQRAVELRPGRVIGEGGMGVVREAEQVALGRVVAIKTVQRRAHATTATNELLHESWIAGALEHPNIVPVHHLDVDEDGAPLLIMKRVDGVEWSTLLRDAAAVQQRFGAADLLEWNLGILIQVLNGLRFAHSRGVIHRDLKPSNVMIGDFGEVYLLDWGIAVSLRDDGSGRFPLAADATEIAGTPCYMAPEMLGRSSGAEHPLSERTDVYLAGAVLYELIAGRAPHGGPTAEAVIASILTAPELPDGAPPELAALCLRALALDPGERFASIEALQLAIQGYLDHRDSARLAARAGERLDELLARVATAARRGDDSHREEIHRQLAICRFGFHEALAAWRDNPEARAGLARATIAVAEYELAAGDPRAAVALLSELDERPALLATAQAAAASHAARRDALERWRSDHDPHEGARVRWLFGVVFAVLFTIAPLLSGLFPDQFGIRRHAMHLAWSLGCFSVFSVFAAVWRNRIMVTSINRRLFSTAAYLFLCQSVLSCGAWSLGLPVEYVQLLMLFLYGVVAGSLAIHSDRYLAINAALYFAAFLISARAPEWRLFAMSASNLALALVVLLRWRPTG